MQKGLKELQSMKVRENVEMGVVKLHCLMIGTYISDITFGLFGHFFGNAVLTQLINRGKQLSVNFSNWIDWLWKEGNRYSIQISSIETSR
jgi:hypothetical protein